MKLPEQSSSRISAGFSLIEVMVGMVIAMLGILVMTQIFMMSEGQKRTTTGGDDALNSGAIGLFALQRDLRHAGWGTSNFKMIGCDVLFRAGVTIPNMAPVTINPPTTVVPAGDANTDTLLVISGSTNGSPEGDGITSQPAANIYAVQTPTSFATNDWVVAMPQNRPTPCSGANQLRLDRVTASAAPNISVVTGVASMSNGTLFNFGQTVRANAYAIRGGALTQCDYIANDCSNAGSVANAAVWVPVADGIVSMRAQYGRDTTTPGMDAIIDADGWDQFTPATVATLACDWTRIGALRIALVARSGMYEKDNVTAASNPSTTPGLPPKPIWEGEYTTPGNTNAPGNARPINLTADANWQHYRYKVFQTVVPLRNISWQGVQTGC